MDVFYTVTTFHNQTYIVKFYLLPTHLISVVFDDQQGLTSNYDWDLDLISFTVSRVYKSRGLILMAMDYRLSHLII